MRNIHLKAYFYAASVLKSVTVYWNIDNDFYYFVLTMNQTISSHLAEFSVNVISPKLPYYKQQVYQDITDGILYVVTGHATAASTGADDTTTGTTPADVVTTTQAAAATTNPGVSLCY